MREKGRRGDRQGEEAEEQTNKSEKERQGDTEAGRNFILTSFLRVIQEGRQLGKLTRITTGQQGEEGGDEGVWAVRGAWKGEEEEDKCCSQMKTKG